MIQALRNIKKISGKGFSRFYSPILLQLLDSILNMGMFSIMIFVLSDLLEGQFTQTRLVALSIYGAICFVGRLIVYSISYLQTQHRGCDLASKLRIDLGNHIRSLNLGYFDSNNIGKITSSLSNDIADFEQVLTHSLGAFVNVIACTLLAIIFSATIDIRFTLIITTIVFIGFPLLSISGKKANAGSTKLKIAINNVVSRVIEYVSGIKTFRLYNITGEKFKRMDNSFLDLKKESIRTELSIMPWSMSFSTITSLLIPIGLISGSYFLKHGDISGDIFIMLVMLTISISNMFTTLGTLYPQFRFISKASENILNLLEEQPLPYKNEVTSFNNYDIAFHNVSFSYILNRPVLQNISFIAKQGTKTALIGPSGSGKSTITNLISRFWDVQSGYISVGEINIREIKPDNLTKEIAVVFQNVYLLHDTIMNNIKMNNPNIRDEDVIQACKDANCYDFIMKKEHGFDTVVAEGGSTLSGGEKQRISIARAIAKNAPIILLDESTSNLDSDNEIEINQALSKLMKNKTCLVIAHRLETIQDADNIIVLDKGNILEEGSHDVLMKKNGWYQKMIEEQQKARKWQIKK